MAWETMGYSSPSRLRLIQPPDFSSRSTQRFSMVTLNASVSNWAHAGKCGKKQKQKNKKQVLCDPNINCQKMTGFWTQIINKMPYAIQTATQDANVTTLIACFIVSLYFFKYLWYGTMLSYPKMLLSSQCTSWVQMAPHILFKANFTDACTFWDLELETTVPGFREKSHNIVMSTTKM